MNNKDIVNYRGHVLHSQLRKLTKDELFDRLVFERILHTKELQYWVDMAQRDER